MNIAIFHNLPSGGGKRVLYELTKRLSINNHLDEYRLDSSIKYLDLSEFVNNTFIYKYENGANFINFLYKTFFSLRKLHKRIASDIDKKRYDFVLVNHDYLTKSPYILRYLKTPTIYICHEPQREYYENIFLHATTIKDIFSNILRMPIKFIDQNNGKKATKIISNSLYSKKVLEKIYKKESSIVYPGVDVKLFKPDKFISKKNQVISVGSLMPYKGNDFIIRALSKISYANRPEYLIVGNGREKEVNRLKVLANKYSVRLTIKKNLSDTELVSEYRHSLILVSGAHHEPFGLSIIEAMACGTPAVVVREGGSGEQIKFGVNGYYCERDIRKFAKLLKLAIKRNQQLSKESVKEVVRNWTWDNSYKELIKIIDSFK